ncbi:hypothetical protein BC567DRAFT_221637 [Phyllosticta citribraziliensis]
MPSIARSPLPGEPSSSPTAMSPARRITPPQKSSTTGSGSCCRPLKAPPSSLPHPRGQESMAFPSPSTFQIPTTWPPMPKPPF